MTYRFLGAASLELASHPAADLLAADLRAAGPLVPGNITSVKRTTTKPKPSGPTTAEVRAWALAAGHGVSDRGRLRPEVWAEYRAAHDLTDRDR